MPVYDPSTHDDLIDIAINLSTPNRGTAGFSTTAIMQANVTPGGGLSQLYASSVEVAADVLAGNLDAVSQALADVAFGQIEEPDSILIIGVDVAGAQTYVQALDLAIAAADDFYGVVIDSRLDADILAVGADIENKADTGTYFIFGFQNDDADWLTSGIAAAFSGLEDFERAACYYHDANLNDAASARVDVANFVDRLAHSADVKSAGWNATVQEVPALTTSLTEAQKVFARANFANTALPMGTRTTTFIDPGHNLNGRPIDHIVSADWLRARGAEAIADLITETSERGVKITVDADGQSLIGSVLDAVFAEGVDIGHFLDYSLTPLEITSADIAAQQVRFDGQAQLASGIRQVQITLYFDTDPI